MSYIDLYLNKNTIITNPDEDSDKLVHVFGVPFDSTHSFRPGTRFGPDSIRNMFNNIEIFHADLGVDLETVNIKDHGNIQHTVNVQEMLQMVNKVSEELQQDKKLIIILGGEHSLTLGSYTSFPQDTAFVVFDAHYDLRESYSGTQFSHASYLRRIAEKNGPDSIIHVGARSFVKEELSFVMQNKIKTISDLDIRSGKGPALLRDSISSFSKIYLSVDMDVFDPAFAPGVGNPEAAGITPRELFDMLYAIQIAKISCLDIVELNPVYDFGATASLAAKIISTVIAMNVK